LQHHLRQATRNDVHQWDARVTLAQLYVAGKEPAKAIAELERVVAARPELQLDLARLYAQTGRTSDARLAASKAAAFFQARAAAEPDQPQHQLRWAASEVLRADYEQSVKILTAGLSRPDPQPFRQALAAAYLGWLDARRKEGKLNAAQQAEFLERIIEHDPQCAPALAMLAELATRQDEDVEQAAALLRRILARGAAPAVVHLILGTRALHQGNAEVGLMHLEQAQQQNARIPEVLNNLAWGLAQQEQPDLPRALQLAEAALKLSSHPEIHDTLGTVLAQLGRPREAVTHLERALRGLPARADAHRKLAALYEQLGDSELAAEHRRLAQPQEAGR
jgi:tetratricopeptide (TPR) repeat protein